MAEVHVFGRVTNDLQLKMSHRQVPYVSFGLVEWIGRRDQYRVYIKEKHDSFPLFFLMISQHISRENICQRGVFSFSHLTGRKCARMINAFTLFI